MINPYSLRDLYENAEAVTKFLVDHIDWDSLDPEKDQWVWELHKKYYPENYKEQENETKS